MVYCNSLFRTMNLFPRSADSTIAASASVTATVTVSYLKSSTLWRSFSNDVDKPLDSKSNRGLNEAYTISTPIFYVNAEPHIGHLYTSLLADASSRWKRLNNYNTKFVTGTDEHGLKVQRSAIKAGEPVIDYCDRISSKYQDMFTAFNIEYTDFTRTTSGDHRKAVEHFWTNISRYLYKGVYSGWYCTNDETFLTTNQVEQVKDSNGHISVISKESSQPCEWWEEENYMFPLHQFKDELTSWLNTDVIYPSSFVSSLSASLSNLGELSVSRSTERLHWGITVPNDSSQRIYVWLDALVNYLTACGYPDSTSCWPYDYHIVGKDILKDQRYEPGAFYRFHAIYWPAFLLAADLPLPKKILCHSHWMVGDRKMSKSLGNVVNPMEMVDKYKSDGLRFYLLKTGVLGHNGNINEHKMLEYLNNDLSNTLGNLLNRCSSKSINPSQKFPQLDVEVYEFIATDDWKQLMDNLYKLPAEVSVHYDEFNFYKGIEAVMTQLRLTNKFMEDTKPWNLKSDPSNKDTLNVILHIVLENLRICGILLQPIIPDITSNMLSRLGIEEHERSFDNLSGKITKCRDITAGPALYKRL